MTIDIASGLIPNYFYSMDNYAIIFEVDMQICYSSTFDLKLIVSLKLPFVPFKLSTNHLRYCCALILTFIYFDNSHFMIRIWYINGHKFHKFHITSVDFH